jgi:hypothetical protein
MTPAVERQRLLKARNKSEAGDFDRQVISREPSDIYCDDVVLECGHKSYLRMIASLRKQDSKVYCGACADAWIKSGASE